MVDEARQEAAPSAEGTLAKTPFPHLLVFAHDRQLSGTMELRGPAGEMAAILFIDGCPHKARTSEPVAYLGRTLLELGVISESALDASLRRLAEEKRLHGQILLESGAITQDQLVHGLRVQLANKLQHLARMPAETSFAYYDAFDALADYGGDDDASLDPYPLVWRAIRDEPSWEHVHATLTRVGALGLCVGADGQTSRFAFQGPEQGVVDLLRMRPWRLHDLTAAGALSPSLTQLLVYCLLITKQLELVRESLVPEPVAAAPSSPVLLDDVPEPPSSNPRAVAKVQLQTLTNARSGPPNVIESKAEGLPWDPRGTPQPMKSPVAPRTAPKPPPVPAPPDGAKAAAAVKAVPTTDLLIRKKEILDRAATIEGETYFEMLGVPENSTPDQAKSAYFGLAKQWHPDRLPAALADIRDACAKVFAQMSEAHQTLIDLEKRARYTRLLQQGGATKESEAEIVRVVEAATNFQKAEICLKRNDLAQAEELCRQAVQSDPGQANYNALLAWLEAMKPANQGPAATEEMVLRLGKAIALNANCERAYFYRGMLQKRLHREAAAVKDFRKAFELNPRNLDAQREVRLFDMRAGGSGAPPPKKKHEEEKGGLFGKLFKK